MPDIFIPLDTSENSKYLNDVYRNGIFNKFTLKYVDQHRAELNTLYPEFKSFATKFVVNDQMLNEFFETADAEGIKRNEEEIKRSTMFIRRQLKAIIANQLWGTNEYYQVVNENNPMLKEAMRQMKSDSFKKMKLSY